MQRYEASRKLRITKRETSIRRLFSAHAQLSWNQVIGIRCGPPVKCFQCLIEVNFGVGKSITVGLTPNFATGGSVDGSLGSKISILRYDSIILFEPDSVEKKLQKSRRTPMLVYDVEANSA